MTARIVIVDPKLSKSLNAKNNGIKVRILGFTTSQKYGMNPKVMKSQCPGIRPAINNITDKKNIL